MATEVEVAPLRTLSDFLLESARFQIPNFKDVEKWGNRVTQNLLYYQTNYFLTAIIIFLIVGLIHPTKMLCGMLAIVVAFGLFFYLTNTKHSATRFKKNHPWISLLLIFSGGYFIVYMLGSVLVFLFGILLPVAVIFIHASTRLRNIKNKITNKIETIGLKRTPMGLFLEALGQEQEFGSVLRSLTEEVMSSDAAVALATSILQCRERREASHSLTNYRDDSSTKT